MHTKYNVVTLAYRNFNNNCCMSDKANECCINKLYLTGWVLIVVYSLKLCIHKGCLWIPI